ncbi:hypothetical protein DK389_08170 [Methylobacterium durans]|uniref:Mannose-6-phosphate isomerase n=1 Tax=Methylobacterium durans TaxID=2202825 RepID=A0A2U8W4F0_9HYPH|nr:hypothetical protein DK389_08170 [Methylobacterium durans]
MRLGWTGEGRGLVRHGLDALQRHHITDTGEVLPLVAADGRPLSRAFDLYDQAFVLFGLAAAAAIGERVETVVPLAARLRDRMIAGWKHPEAGFEEARPRRLPLRSNPHMHLFEACLAWAEQGGDAAWRNLADEIAELCLRRFRDPETGALREHFDGAWRRIDADGLEVVEPGHQAEWAWLLTRWGLSRGRADALAAARRLTDILEGYGISSRQGLAVNALNGDLSLRDPLLRLWPQTERIKAWIARHWLAEDSAAASACDAQIAELGRQLFRYADHPVRGSWWENLDASGRPVSEPARASSLYHLTCAIAELAPAGSVPTAGPRSSSAHTPEITPAPGEAQRLRAPISNDARVVASAARTARSASGGCDRGVEVRRDRCCGLTRAGKGDTEHCPRARSAGNFAMPTNSRAIRQSSDGNRPPRRFRSVQKRTVNMLSQLRPTCCAPSHARAANM